jgi:predicted AAA+ superfamily ATPase
MKIAAELFLVIQLRNQFLRLIYFGSDISFEENDANNKI